MPYPTKGEQRNTGRTHFTKGNIPWNKSEPVFDDCRACSISFQLQKLAYRGLVLTCSKECSSALRSSQRTASKSHLWKGGCIPWAKKQAKLRDDYTCQVCDLRDPLIVVVDHIKPKAIAPHLAAEIDNLMTLCPNCHAYKTVEDRKVIRKLRA